MRTSTLLWITFTFVLLLIPNCRASTINNDLMVEDIPFLNSPKDISNVSLIFDLITNLTPDWSSDLTPTPVPTTSEPTPTPEPTPVPTPTFGSTPTSTPEPILTYTPTPTPTPN